MKKKLRLRGYVLFCLIAILVGVISYSSYEIYKIVQEENDNYSINNYVDKEVHERIVPTITVTDAVIKPFSDESVIASIPYYNQNDDDKTQQDSLIYYENIYMQNTGIMYTSENKFDVLAVLDGTIKNIKDDEIMGKIIEIEHNPNVISIYQSVDNVNVSVGQKVNQGQIIAQSSTNPIVDSKLNALHFEVYKNGELINPESFYKLSIQEINE